VSGRQAVSAKFPATKLFLVLLLALAVTPACFVRRRAVTPPATRRSAPVLAASKDELIQRLHAVSDPIQSFLMTADLSPSVLEPFKGTATDYATVSAYVLFRKPGDLRILGRDPVIGSTIFDMVSNGRQFRVSIPPKQRFLIGNNDAPGTSGNKLENLRPSALLVSLMINPPDPKTDWPLLENDIERALYILLIIRHDHDDVTLARQVYFDGHTLEISRQKTFDASGSITSDTKYSDWKTYNGVPFPCTIDIQRPKDNYEVQLSVVSLKINTPEVTDEKFVLKPPPDVQVQELK
jgi:hypothetical protein